VFDVQNLDITPSEECRAIKFFSKEDLLKEQMLTDQTRPLLGLFNPEDFARLKR